MRWTQIEGAAYWSLFVATFLGVAIWESIRAKRPLTTPASRRWSRHGMLFTLNAVLVAVVLRINPVVAAVAAAHSRFGVLNKIWIPFVVRCVLAVLLLDLVKYAVHRAHHSVPWLWRVHVVHHSDPDFDVSTAARAHPIEMLLTQGATLAAIGLLAAPPVAVLGAELLACFQSFFEHANASLPSWIEKLVRRLIVTPDMHRIHHSQDASEQSRNLGEIFPWWDRMLGTYCARPKAGDEMVTGLKGFGGNRTLGLRFLLTQPLEAPPPMT